MAEPVLMYLYGFGIVWAAVALVWAGIAGASHFSRRWDRAFEKELLGAEQKQLL
ncbi:MAG: hypothetical protein M3124_07390 [Actinomycetota bacterium]|nr:hypothetical protein [Actinomycetota bacterium]